MENGSHFKIVKLLYLPLTLQSLVNKASLYRKKTKKLFIWCNFFVIAEIEVEES
jgi:hypothetical protein